LEAEGSEVTDWEAEEAADLAEMVETVVGLEAAAEAAAEVVVAAD